VVSYDGMFLSYLSLDLVPPSGSERDIFAPVLSVLGSSATLTSVEGVAPLVPIDHLLDLSPLSPLSLLSSAHRVDDFSDSDLFISAWGLSEFILRIVSCVCFASDFAITISSKRALGEGVTLLGLFSASLSDSVGLSTDLGVLFSFVLS